MLLFALNFTCMLIAHLCSVLVTISAVSYRYDCPDLFCITFRLYSTRYYSLLFHQYIGLSVSRSYRRPMYVHIGCIEWSQYMKEGYMINMVAINNEE